MVGDRKWEPMDRQSKALRTLGVTKPIFLDDSLLILRAQIPEVSNAMRASQHSSGECRMLSAWRVAALVCKPPVVCVGYPHGVLNTRLLPSLRVPLFYTRSSSSRRTLFLLCR